MIHWWLPGIVKACDADISQQFTGEPDEVTCPLCKAYVQDRLTQARRNAREYADRASARFT